MLTKGIKKSICLLLIGGISILGIPFQAFADEYVEELMVSTEPPVIAIALGEAPREPVVPPEASEPLSEAIQEPKALSEDVLPTLITPPREPEPLIVMPTTPIPEGWTRAESNPNFAFKSYSGPAGPSPYNRWTVYSVSLLDLRTGEIVDVPERSGDSSSLYSIDGYDVSSDGKYFVYTVANAGPPWPGVGFMWGSDLYTYHIATGESVKMKVKDYPAGDLMEVAIDPETNLIKLTSPAWTATVVDGRPVRTELEQTIEYYDPETGEKVDPPLPEGYTRAESNPNFAFKDEYLAVGATKLVLRNLITSEEQTLIGSSTSHKTLGDVSPDGSTVIYGKYYSGGGTFSYVQSISDPSKKITLEEAVTSIEFSSNELMLQTETGVIDAKYFIDLATLEITKTTYLAQNPSAVTVDPVTNLILHIVQRDRYTQDVQIFDASQGLENLSLLTTHVGGHWEYVIFSETYQTPHNSTIVIISIMPAGTGLQRTYLINPHTGRKLEFEGEVTSVDYSGSEAVLHLNRRAHLGGPRIAWVNLDVLVEITGTASRSISPDGQWIYYQAKYDPTRWPRPTIFKNFVSGKIITFYNPLRNISFVDSHMFKATRGVEPIVSWRVNSNYIQENVLIDLAPGAPQFMQVIDYQYKENHSNPMRLYGDLGLLKVMSMLYIFDASQGFEHLTFLNLQAPGGIKWQPVSAESYQTPEGEDIITVSVRDLSKGTRETFVIDPGPRETVGNGGETGKTITLQGTVADVTYYGNIAKYTLELADGATQVTWVDLNTLTILKGPPLPEGYTRAESNPNFAYWTAVEQIEEASRKVTYLRNLLTGKEIVVARGIRVKWVDVSADGRYVTIAKEIKRRRGRAASIVTVAELDGESINKIRNIRLPQGHVPQLIESIDGKIRITTSQGVVFEVDPQTGKVKRIS